MLIMADNETTLMQQIMQSFEQDPMRWGAHGSATVGLCRQKFAATTANGGTL
jgi:hypothetical protein